MIRRKHREKLKDAKKRIRHSFYGVGIVLVTLALLALAIWTASLVRGFAEDVIQRQTILRLISVQLVSSSFTDLFSGVGWINQDETTLYQDRQTTAFTFPPNFSWRKIADPEISVSNITRLYEQIPDNDIAQCLSEFCLVQRNADLFFVPLQKLDGYNRAEHRLNLPSSIKETDLVNLTIGALETKWIIGVVEQEGEIYSGKVFYFDGEEFTGVFAESILFQSQYKGVIGFGGDDDNLLVIYGAYEGLAYHIRSGVQPRDISHLFNIRIMGGGFYPVVIRDDLGAAGAAWYVFSITEGDPKLIKLFQNGTNEIVGMVNFSKLLFNSNVRKAAFYLDDTSGVLRGWLTMSSGDRSWWKFMDNGFDKSKELVVRSVNINNYPAEIRRASITGPDLTGQGAEIEFELSNNGADWYVVEPGEMFVFPKEDGRFLLWRARFIPDNNSETSPFFDKIQLSYRVKFL